jgi:hypothetical protein
MNQRRFTCSFIFALFCLLFFKQRCQNARLWIQDLLVDPTEKGKRLRKLSDYYFLRTDIVSMNHIEEEYKIISLKPFQMLSIQRNSLTLTSIFSQHIICSFNNVLFFQPFILLSIFVKIYLQTRLYFILSLEYRQQRIISQSWSDIWIR